MATMRQVYNGDTNEQCLCGNDDCEICIGELYSETQAQLAKTAREIYK